MAYGEQVAEPSLDTVCVTPPPHTPKFDNMSPGKGAVLRAQTLLGKALHLLRPAPQTSLVVLSPTDGFIPDPKAPMPRWVALAGRCLPLEPWRRGMDQCWVGGTLPKEDIVEDVVLNSYSMSISIPHPFKLNGQEQGTGQAGDTGEGPAS